MRMNLKEGFRERLIQLRSSARLSQDGLATLTGISRSCIRGLESGTSAPRADSLTKLADYFHVTTDYLLGRDENEYLTVHDLPQEITQHFRDLVRDMEALRKPEDNPLDSQQD